MTTTIEGEVAAPPDLVFRVGLGLPGRRGHRRGQSIVKWSGSW